MIVATVNPDADPRVTIALGTAFGNIQLAVWAKNTHALVQLGWEDVLKLKGALDDAMRELERQEQSGGTEHGN